MEKPPHIHRYISTPKVLSGSESCRRTGAFLCSFSAIILLRLSPLKRIDCLTFNWNFALKLNGLTPWNYAISPITTLQIPASATTSCLRDPAKLHIGNAIPSSAQAAFSPKLANGKWFWDFGGESGMEMQMGNGRMGYWDAGMLYYWDPKRCQRTERNETKRNGTERSKHRMAAN